MILVQRDHREGGGAIRGLGLVESLIKAMKVEFMTRELN